MTSVARLQVELDRRADDAARTWWAQQLRGEAPSRGVSPEAVREAARAWWVSEEHGARARAQQLRVVLDLFVERMTEDKLAATTLLAEKLLDRLVPGDVARIGEVFAAGHVDSGCVCDRLCLDVLAPMIDAAGDPAAIAGAVAAWSETDRIWQRRASCVSLVPIAARQPAAFRGARALALEVCAAVVRDPHPAAQSAVGWLLRELAVADRAAVLRFARSHVRHLSADARQTLDQTLVAE